MRRSIRAIAAIFGLALTGAIAAPAHAESARPGLHSSASAKAAGIARPGQAFMGWSLNRGAAAAKKPAASARSLALPGQAEAAPRQLTPAASSLPKGVDVSAWNTGIDWQALHRSGTTFAYVKATEGDYYTSDTFGTQYGGSYDAGLIRGAYHFANPAVSSGTSQADFFVAHGGGWSGDGQTLPGVLDIEYDPYGPTCYGLTPEQMTAWIASFTSRYKDLTGRDAVIYTTYGWWTQCTGNTTVFSRTNPLWIAYYGSTAGNIPGGWNYHTFWQYSATPYDQDVFNGTHARLEQLAAPGPADPPSCKRAPFSDVPKKNTFCVEITWLKKQGITGGYADGRFRPTTPVSRQAFAHYLYEMYAGSGRQDGRCADGESSGFSDVPSTSTFCTSIRALSEIGVTTGYPDGRFHPKAAISRQAIAAMLYRVYDLAVTGHAEATDAECTEPTPFDDLTAANPFCGDIEFMHDMGLSDGYKDGGYHPASPTSRQAIAAFLYHYDRRMPAPGTLGG